MATATDGLARCASGLSRSVPSASLLAIGAAIVAVFLLLYLALGKVSETLVILATLPDAFVGGIVALLIAGQTWSVSSLVGLIGLFGIAVQNGLVLVTQTRRHPCERGDGVVVG